MQCSGKPSLFVSACCQDLAWQPCDSEGSGPPQSAARGVFTSGVFTLKKRRTVQLLQAQMQHMVSRAHSDLSENLSPAVRVLPLPPENWDHCDSSPQGGPCLAHDRECIAYTDLHTTAAYVCGRKGDGWKAFLPFFDISSLKHQQWSR